MESRYVFSDQNTDTIVVDTTDKRVVCRCERMTDAMHIAHLLNWNEERIAKAGAKKIDKEMKLPNP